MAASNAYDDEVIEGPEKALDAMAQAFTEALDAIPTEVLISSSARDAAQTCFEEGNFALSLLDMAGPDVKDIVVAQYLQLRLGFTGPNEADEIPKRVRHVSRVVVLSGVSLDDAITVKTEFVSLGCKAEIVEGASRSANFKREPIPERVRHEVWRRDEGKCVDCGSRDKLHFDHIVPVSKGGSNTARNIELRCETCNLRKGAKI